MKALEDVLDGVSFVRHSEATLSGVQVRGLAFDTRKIEAGELFVALKGTKADGFHFSSEALSKGALGVVCQHEEQDGLADLRQKYPDRHFITVNHAAEELGAMVSNFYGNPSRHLCLLGVTGTNGKTTIATLLQQLLQQLGERCGLISTVSYCTGDGEAVSPTHTTPDALQLHGLMAVMLRNGCRYACVEVSSHAIAQRRIAGLSFDGGILSNISHDHLDYHGDFRSYVEVKKRFFDDLPKTAFALTNLDDRNGRYVLQNCVAEQKCTYALKRMADYKVRILSEGLHGLDLVIQGVEASFRISGAFNAYNLLAVVGAAHLLGIEVQPCVQVLSGIKGVKGRFEWVSNDKGLNVLIDFAHSPDALEKVFISLSSLVKQHKNAKLFSVLGCGGDRDSGKRSRMGKIASYYSDASWFTSDNPRDEDPQAILDAMQNDLTEEEKRHVTICLQRSESIHAVLRTAERGDFVLISGKGHEEYQEVAGVRHYFSDKSTVEKYLQAL